MDAGKWDADWTDAAQRGFKRIFGTQIGGILEIFKILVLKLEHGLSLSTEIRKRIREILKF